ncbi:hypothetical protein [Ensifer sp. ENS02]|uniref:hypothetical protein n=1 Tax=Ensifer sp. ENS02 TaxID=2769290 RepID=UPI001AEE852C|nr:hypothetical protein [Ensifer sp. ENS02]
MAFGTTKFERSGYGRNRTSDNDGEEGKAEPPKMLRSRSQIATAYAPGVLMTWEGGKGICKAVPIPREFPTALPANVTQTIFEGMKEFAQSWRQRALDACPDAPEEFVLDDPFYDHRTGDVTIDPTRFMMNQPTVVGYVPYPLLYQCGVCLTLREFKSVADQAKRGLPQKCNGHDARWSQVDVVYAHWYGTIEPLNPFNYTFDDKIQDVKPIQNCTCGWTQFKLKNKPPVFSEWRFQCEECETTRELKKAEPNVLRKLKLDSAKPGGRKFEWIEVDMLPVSYRASSAFYPQRASFIELREATVVELMAPGRQEDLIKRLAEIHSIPYREPSDAEIEAAVTAVGRSNEWDDFVAFRKLYLRRQAQGQDAAGLKSDMDKIRESWFVDGLVSRGELSSPAIDAAVRSRGAWARKFDPIRLTVEHAAFVEEHIDAGMQGPRHTAVDVVNPDLPLFENAGVAAELERYRKDVQNVLRLTGVGKMVLVRGLPICEYSFGFSRVSSTPVYHRETPNRKVAMPVRLVAFDEMKNHQRPIYVTQQKNEALYVKLDEERVMRWLKRNDVIDMPPDDVGLSQAYLERYQDFGQFLDDYKDKERQGMPRTLASFVYMLLHSLSHQLIHSLADASGLDRDGIGEYIFPADFAFTIYRKGMTPDLGNISAMWRNHAMDFLRRSIDPRMLRCGSGSLCDSRGGACPACIMVGEVSCAASNLLLSRSVLKGGPAPEWELANSPDIVGYFEPEFNA